MSRDLLLRFVDDRASLSDDELEALARALAADAALRGEARAQLAAHELIDRVLSPARRGLAERVAAALARNAIAAAVAPEPEFAADGRMTAATTPGRPLRSLALRTLAVAVAATLMAALLLHGGERPRLDASACPIVIASSGVVRIDDGRRDPIRAGDRLAESHIVYVQRGGRLDLAYADGSTATLTGIAASDDAALRIEAIAARIDPDPWWTWRRPDPPITRKALSLDWGRLTAQVAPQSAASPLTIRTDAATCLVVGTRFTVSADRGTTRLAVEEGAVEMVRADGRTTVRAGENATATTPQAAMPATHARTATPETLGAALRDLRAGDTLTLVAGEYPDVALSLGSLHGEADAWITITGPERGEAVLIAKRDANTLEIGGAHHLALRRLTLDGDRRAGAYAIAAHEPGGGATHDIRIDDCVIRDYGGWPGAVAVSCKVPAWSWMIRGCTIERCGAGMHLGGFDDRTPFAAATIVGNLISVDERGCIELIGGAARPADAPPTDRTLIADNVLLRDAAAPAAPLVTLDGGPTDAAGARERVELARDVFVGGRGDAAMLLAAGAIDVHDCLFADGDAAAIGLRTRGAPTDARLWHDTIVGCAQGVHAPDDAHRTLIAHCLVCADEPVVGAGVELTSSLLAGRAEAGAFVVDATPRLGALDLHPRKQACRADAWDARAMALDARDFDGDERVDATIPGAYAGPATARSWRLEMGRKPVRDR